MKFLIPSGITSSPKSEKESILEDRGGHMYWGVTLSLPLRYQGIDLPLTLPWGWGSSALTKNQIGHPSPLTSLPFCSCSFHLPSPRACLPQVPPWSGSLLQPLLPFPLPLFYSQSMGWRIHKYSNQKAPQACSEWVGGVLFPKALALFPLSRWPLWGSQP